MFWARGAALAPLLQLDIAWDEYPPEPLPVDGTILHALERLMPSIARAAGYEYAATYFPGIGPLTQEGSNQMKLLKLAVFALSLSLCGAAIAQNTVPATKHDQAGLRASERRSAGHQHRDRGAA